jgi:hypothetical protein
MHLSLPRALRRPEELLEHELCEVVEVRTTGGKGELTGGGGGGSSNAGVDPNGSSDDVSDDARTTVLLRGLRIRVGIDCSADVHADINPACGRMDYRGR